MGTGAITFRRQGLAASLGLHALALGGAVWLVHPSALPVAVEQAISVEIISLSALRNASRPPATPETPGPAPEPSVPEMIHASRMLGQVAFADPRNAEARQMLSMLEAGARDEQWCDIEAMEQIGALDPLRHPEAVVASALADLRRNAAVMSADGAAVLVAGQWLRLEFVCTLAPDRSSVIGFDFRVGDPIPPEDEAKYGLSLAAPD